MPRTDALQLSAIATGPSATAAQKRFATLVKQIEQTRVKRAAWMEYIGAHRLAHARLVRPLQDALIAGLRTWLLAADAVSDEKGWTKAERETISTLIRDAAGDMLDADADDEALKAIFEKHARIDHATDRLQALHANKLLAEHMTGLDLGNADGLRSDQDLYARLRQGLAEQAEAELAAKAAKAAKKKRKSSRETPAQLQREADAAGATQSIREIFRRLASALHPDREPDSAQRAVKTALMQRVNQAYASNDLLTLLELQLQAEQIDPGHIAGASEQRLGQYNQVLAEQLKALQTELQRIEMDARAEFDIAPSARLDPRQLDATLAQASRQLRSDLAQQQLDIAMLYDRAAMKRWLKQQRALMAQADGPFGFDGF